MRCIPFASRNIKEIVRDPINLFFGLGFPLVLLFLLTAIQSNIPVDLFEIQNLAPGIAVFGLSFIALFSGTLISKDRSTSFLTRLFASPMSSTDFIMGYVMPLLPMAILQSAVCLAAAIILGLDFSVHLLTTLLVLIPAALFFIGVGLLTGSIFNDKQVGGICGALLTNLSAWLSGTWFDLELVGGVFKKIAYTLPFVHAVNAAQAAAAGNYTLIFPDLWWVIGYGVVMLVIAIAVFRSKMSSDKI